MGLFSKTVTQRTHRFNTLDEDPLKKHKYGRSTKLKTTPAINFTHKMLQNHAKDTPNKENMRALIKEANTIFEKPFMWKKTSFGRKMYAYYERFDEVKFIEYAKSTLGGIDEVVNWAFSGSNSLISDEYFLKYQLQNYDFNSRTGVIDNYIVKFLTPYNYEIIEEYNPDISLYISKKERAELENRAQTLLAQKSTVEAKLAQNTTQIQIKESQLAQKRDLLTAELSKPIEERDIVLISTLNQEIAILEQEITSFNTQRSTIQEELNIVVSELNSINTRLTLANIPHHDNTISSSGSSESLGVVFNITAYLEQILKEGLFKKAAVQLGVNEETLLKYNSYDDPLYKYEKGVSSNGESLVTITGELMKDPSDVVLNPNYSHIFDPRMVLQKRYTISYGANISDRLLHLDELEDRKDLIYVEYKANGKRVIEYIARNSIFLINENSDIRVSSVIPFKGAGADPNDKYWKLTLMRNGYMYNRRNKLNANKQDLYGQLQANKEIEQFRVSTHLDLRWFFLKRVRASREWQLYLKAFFKYFEKYVKYQDSMELSSKVTINIPNSPSAYRLHIAKKEVNNKKIKKKCFISTEPGSYHAYLYLNLPDYSLSTPQEASVGVYHRYHQYILDLVYFFYGDNTLSPTIFDQATQSVSNPQIFFVNKQMAMRKYDLTKAQEVVAGGFINEGKLPKEDVYLAEFKLEDTGSEHSYSATRVVDPTDKDYTIKITLDEYVAMVNSDTLIGGVNFVDMGAGHEAFKFIKRKRRNRDIPPSDNLDVIPEEFRISQDYKDSTSNITNKYMSYIPPMPVKLWYRVPYIAKLEVYNSTLFYYLYMEWQTKESTWFGEILKPIKIIVGAILVGYGFPEFGYPMIASTLAAEVAEHNKKLSWLPTAINVVGVVYGGYSGGWTAQSFFGNNTIVAASQTLSYASNAQNFLIEMKTRGMVKEFAREMSSNKEEFDRVTKDLEEFQEGVALDTFNVDSNTEDEIDMFYKIMYGEIIYNNYDKYYTNYEKTYNYDRLK